MGIIVATTQRNRFNKRLVRGPRAQWIVKTEPKTGEYLQATIRDSEEPDKIEITAKTVVKFILRKPDAIRILAPTYIPKME